MIDAAFGPGDVEGLVDPRLRELVERYARLVGATVQELEPQLVELSLPHAEVPHFRGGPAVRIAFSPAALERHPDAEMAVVGSAFFEELVNAVRTRGARRAFGLIPPTAAADTNGLPPTLPVRRGSAEPPVVSLALRPVARLVARVAIQAAGIVTEHIAESGVFDLATGFRASDAVAGLCRDIEAGKVMPASDRVTGVEALPARPLAELVPLMLGDIESKLATELTRHRHDAAQALATEMARIDRYYGQLLEEAAESAWDPVNAEERRAIAVEHRRRRAEEERRHEVRATVHPLQLVEFSVLVQRVDWNLVTQRGRRATLTAQRTLSGGSGAWQLACPHCATSPKELLICRHDHVACTACGKTCRVCGDDFCGGHGIVACHIDEEPACDAHARTCPACGKPHCTAHAGTCSAGGHSACSACLGPCGVCGKVVCATHAVRSDSSAPKGERRLCLECMVYCEGKTNEPVGRDEAVRCSSCEAFVCANHRAACVVDQLVHCSTHLRRADGSRRLVCERHRGTCGGSHEAAVVFASDEVVPCPACGKSVCDAHARTCVADNCPRKTSVRLVSP